MEIKAIFGSKAATFPMVLGACLLLGACNWMYFHDDEYEKQAKLTADTVKALDASKDVGAWDTRVTELQQKYERQYADQLLAMRNYEIALILKGDPLRSAATSTPVAAGLPGGGTELLRAVIRLRLQKIVGLDIDQPGSDEQLRRWIDVTKQLQVAETQLDANRSRYLLAKAQYAAEASDAEKKRDLTCRALLKEFTETPDVGPPALAVVWLYCKTLESSAREKLKEANLPDGVADYYMYARGIWSPQPGDAGPKPCDATPDWDEAAGEFLARAGGADEKAPELVVITDELKAALLKETWLQGCRAALAAKLKKLTDAAEPKEKGANGAEKIEEVTGALKDLHAFLEKAEGEIKVDALKSMIAVLDAATKIDLGKLANPDTSSGDAAAECKPAGDKPATDAPAFDPCFLNVVLGFLGQSQAAIAEYSAESPGNRVRENLIRLSVLRRQLLDAQVDYDAQTAKRDIVVKMALAVITEASDLSLAGIAIGRVSAGPQGLMSVKNDEQRQSASLALAAYSASWEHGRIPLRVLEIRPEWVVHHAEVARDVAAAKLSKANIDAALAAIQAYAEGGIKIEDVISLLTHLGIIGAIAA